MNFLKTKTSWSNIELGIFKICVLSAGIILGMYFFEYLKKYTLQISGVLLFTSIITVYLWIKKMKE